MTLEALQAALQPIMERVLDLEKNRAQGAPPGTAGGAGQTGNTPEGTAAGDGGGPSGAAAPGGSPSSIPADPGTADMAVPGDRDFSSYLEGNPYERPIHEAVKTEPHTWDLTETPGCVDYRLAQEQKDKAAYEIRNLHGCLSYAFAGLQEMLENLEELEEKQDSALAPLQSGFRRAFYTLSGVYDLLERRRTELDIIARAKSTSATEEDKMAAEHVKALSRGFAGGAPLRHEGLAKIVEDFMREASNSRMKQLAKEGVSKQRDSEKGKRRKRKEASNSDQGGARSGGRQDG